MRGVPGGAGHDGGALGLHGLANEGCNAIKPQSKRENEELVS